MPAQNGHARDHVLREMRVEIRDLADEGMSAEAIDRHLNGHRRLDRRRAGNDRSVDLPRRCGGQGALLGRAAREELVKTLLGQRVAEGINDSRALAATVVFRMPADLRGVEVREFLGWIQGSNGPLVSEYMRAATIHPGPGWAS